MSMPLLQSNILDSFSCNGGKLETSKGYIFLFVVFSVLESKYNLTYKRFGAQYLIG